MMILAELSILMLEGDHWSHECEETMTESLMCHDKMILEKLFCEHLLLRTSMHLLDMTMDMSLNLTGHSVVEMECLSGCNHCYFQRLQLSVNDLMMNWKQQDVYLLLD